MNGKALPKKFREMLSFLSSKLFSLSRGSFLPKHTENIFPNQIPSLSSGGLYQYSLQHCFSKYIPRSRAKRQPLNTKRAGKGYKKGYGARKEGVVNSKGK